MSLFATLAADILVAVLLVSTIASCLRLSRRIAGLKADETAMRQTVGELVVASANAERAIKGLRTALDECDRTLAERMEAGGRLCTDLGDQVKAGESVVARIGAIVVQMRGAQRSAAGEAGPAVQPLKPVVRVPEPTPTTDVTNEDRLSATLAAAHALSERALDRIRAKAA